MEKREVTIPNRLGLHARAAVKLVSVCMRYTASVTLLANGRRANGRRLIALLMLSAAMGARVSIEASGPDEKRAVVAIERLITNGFGEG